MGKHIKEENEINKCYKFKINSDIVPVIVNSKNEIIIPNALEEIEKFLDVEALIYNFCRIIQEQNYNYSKNILKEKPKYISKFDFQKNAFPVLFEKYPYLKNYNSRLLRYPIEVIDAGYQKFFNDCKRKKKTSKPFLKKQKSYNQEDCFNSICWNDSIDSVVSNLWIAKIENKFYNISEQPHKNLKKLENKLQYIRLPFGSNSNRRYLVFQIIQHAEVVGEICRIQLTKHNDKWSISFTVRDIKSTIPHRSKEIVGIDQNVNEDRMLATFDGTASKCYKNPSDGKKILQTKKKIKKLKQKSSRVWELNFYKCIDCGYWHHENRQKIKNNYIGSFHCKKCGSQQDFVKGKNLKGGIISWQRKRYKKIQNKISKLESYVVAFREYKQYEYANELAKKYYLLVVEDLNIAGLKQGKRVSKEFHKTAISGQMNKIARKSFEQNGVVIKIYAPYTSQTCNRCGCCNEKNRKSQSIFECIQCGHIDNADDNASKNIHDLGVFACTCKKCNHSSSLNIKKQNDVTMFECEKCGFSKEYKMVSMEEYRLEKKNLTNAV